MLLKKIVLNNIRSYESEEINFTEGSTLLSGDIGSGKTSVLLGIEFALFGLQPGQRGNALLRNGADRGGVTLELEIDGNEIVIERVLKRGKTISQDYCAISINGEKKELSVTELKNKVLELIDYPKEFSKKQNILYKFTVYTPQEEMKQIILQDAGTRMDTLRHVFGIDRYKRILENVSVLISKIREEKRLNEGRIMNLEQEKIVLAQRENEFRAKLENMAILEKEFFQKGEQRKGIQNEKEEIQKKIQEKNKLIQEIEKSDIILSGKKEMIFNTRKSMDELRLQIDEMKKLTFDESRIPELENEIKKNLEEKENLNNQILEINSGINSLSLSSEEIKKLEQQICNLESCPTCLQEINAVYRANVLNKSHNDLSRNNLRMEALNQDKAVLSEKVKFTGRKIETCRSELDNLRLVKIKLGNLEEKQKSLAEKEKTVLSLEKDVGFLKNHVRNLQVSAQELNRFDILFETVSKQLEEALRKERLSEIRVAEVKREVEFLSVQIQETKEKIKETEAVKQKIDYLSGLENWLSGEFAVVISHIEKNVMVRLESEFSKLFAEWFAMLVSDSFNVTLRDDFTPIIEQHDYEIDYAYLSGGERTAIALAYRLALNQVINSLMSKIKTRDIVILDEPTDGFSGQQLDKMRDVLQELNVKQLIIVSHEQKIEGFVENVIRFGKENGVSKRE